MDRIDDAIRTYEHVPFPVLVCDRAMTTRWANNSAGRLYPALTDVGVVSPIFEEFDKTRIFETIRRLGSYTIDEPLPFLSLRVTLLPLGGEQDPEGVAAILLQEEGPHPARPPGQARTNTAQALNRSIREAVTGIFNIMDDTSIKADVLNLGWIKTGFRKISLENYRILRIAENMTEYAKLQSGDAQIGVSAVDTGEFLNEIGRFLQFFSQMVHIPLSVACAEDCVAVRADQSLLELALFNVIHNSLYYTRPGNSVQISAASRNRQVLFQVRDQGMGIPAAYLEEVWRPYRSFSWDGGERCTGLGLAVVRAAVQAMGGSCSLESVEGEGTTVTLALSQATISTPRRLAQGGERPMQSRFSRAYVGLYSAVGSPRLPGESS